MWLGASDVEEEGVWRDSETGDKLDIEEFWGPGQPNGVRVQNCAGIWELVRKRLIRKPCFLSKIVVFPYCADKQ